MPKHLTKKKQGAVNRPLFLNFIQLFIQQGNRQSDHVKVVALDLPDKQRTLALNSVSACFVRRIARGDVFLDLRVAKFIKFNLGDLRKPGHRPGGHHAGERQGHPCEAPHRKAAHRG